MSHNFPIHFFCPNDRIKQVKIAEKSAAKKCICHRHNNFYKSGEVLIFSYQSIRQNEPIAILWYFFGMRSSCPNPANIITIIIRRDRLTAPYRRRWPFATLNWNPSSQVIFVNWRRSIFMLTCFIIFLLVYYPKPSRIIISWHKS